MPYQQKFKCPHCGTAFTVRSQMPLPKVDRIFAEADRLFRDLDRGFRRVFDPKRWRAGKGGRDA